MSLRCVYQVLPLPLFPIFSYLPPPPLGLSVYIFLFLSLLISDVISHSLPFHSLSSLSLSLSFLHPVFLISFYLSHPSLSLIIFLFLFLSLSPLLVYLLSISPALPLSSFPISFPFSLISSSLPTVYISLN